MEGEQKCKACGGAHPTGACTQSETEQLGMDIKGFKVGDVVKVKRSDGTIEAGWKVSKLGVMGGTTMVVVVNGEGQDALAKGIPAEDLTVMQNMKTKEEWAAAQAKRDEPVVPDRRRVVELEPGEQELIDFIEAEVAQVKDVAGMKNLVKKADQYLQIRGVLNTGDAESAKKGKIPVRHFTITIDGENYGFSLSKIRLTSGYRYSFLPSGENILKSLKILADNDQK